jgi:hypothetical protein
MPLAHLVIALLVALLFGTIIGTIIQYRKGYSGYPLVLFALTMFIWAGGIWLIPFGPAVFGVYPYPFILVGLALALFMAGLLGSRPRRAMSAVPSPEFGGRESDLGPLAVVFWMLIGLLALMITVRYLMG